MKRALSLISILAPLALAACEVAPAGAPMMLVPGPGKTQEAFRDDDNFCRAQIGAPDPGDAAAQQAAEAAYGQCMVARGNVLQPVPTNYATPPYPYAYPPAAYYGAPYGYGSYWGGSYWGGAWLGGPIIIGGWGGYWGGGWNRWPHHRPPPHGGGGWGGGRPPGWPPGGPPGRPPGGGGGGPPGGGGGSPGGGGPPGGGGWPPGGGGGPPGGGGPGGGPRGR